MPKIRTHPTCTILDVEPDNKPLAIRAMGDGHNGTSARCGCLEKISTRCHGLFQ